MDLLKSVQWKIKEIFQGWGIPNNLNSVWEKEENVNNWKNVFGQAAVDGRPSKNIYKRNWRSKRSWKTLKRVKIITFKISITAIYNAIARDL